MEQLNNSFPSSRGKDLYLQGTQILPFPSILTDRFVAIESEHVLAECQFGFNDEILFLV